MADLSKSLTPSELSDLKAKAKAATPGPWKTRFNGNVTAITKDGYALFRHVVTRLSAKYEQAVHDCDYVSAANPETILRLIAMIERRDEQIEKLRSVLSGAKRFGNFTYYTRLKGQNEEYCDFVDSLSEALAATEPHDDK